MLVFALLCLVAVVSGYECSDGCVISDSFVDDNGCDCNDCGDETNWNCDSCECPTTCGGYSFCAGQIANSTDFHCDDGCQLENTLYVNDGWCDCLECEDEDEWTCASCPGCPTTCGGYVPCEGVDNSTGGGNTTAASGFTCDDGCVIGEFYVGDDFCDCANCEDETVWDCESCGGCPAECGGYAECALPTTEAPTTEAPTTEAPATTEALTTEAPMTTAPTQATGPTRNDSAAVRLLLAAALSLLSAMAL